MAYSSKDGNNTFQTFTWFVGSFFIPLFLILFLYFKIFLTQSKMATNRRLIETGEGRKQVRLFGILSTLNRFQLYLETGNWEIKERMVIGRSRYKLWTHKICAFG